MLNSDFQKLSVTGLVTLYELDATKLGADVWQVSFNVKQVFIP